MGNCPGCGRKTVPASFRVGGGGGGGNDSDGGCGGGGGGGGDSDGGGSDGWDSFMAAHSRKEESDEKFCETVWDISAAKDDGKVALVLMGSGWMGSIRDQLNDEPALMAQVERIVVKNMGMDFDESDMFAFILRHLPALKSLEFSCHHWGAHGFDAEFCAHGLAQLKRLESLELYEVHLIDAAAPNVAKALAALPHLKRLDIAGADRFDSDWGITSREKDEKLTLKGYAALLGAVRGRLQYLKVDFDLATNGVGSAKLIQELASAGLRELVISIGDYGASDEQIAKIEVEWAGMLRHFAASCPALVALTFDCSQIKPDTLIETIGGNAHLEELKLAFNEWSLEQFVQMLKAIYASKIVSFKQDGYLSFPGQSWWRITRLVKQFADKTGWRGFEGDLAIYNRLTSDQIERCWGTSRYRTSDVSSDETPDKIELLFEDDAPRPARGGAPAMAPARRVPPTRVGGGASVPVAARVPPGRVGVPAPARAAVLNAPTPARGLPTVPARGVGSAPGRAARPLPTLGARGAPPTPPARSGGATGLSGRAAIAAARAAPAPAPIAVPDGVAGNWKLKDKKSIKNEASALDDAVASVKSKLGDQWMLVIDWASFGEASSSREDREPGENVLQRVVAKFIANDVDEFDSDVVDALNGLCESKRVTFSCVSEHGGGERATVHASASGVTIVWSADWWGYEYRDSLVRDWVLSNC